jgi:hypothetical protein
MYPRLDKLKLPNALNQNCTLHFLLGRKTKPFVLFEHDALGSKLFAHQKCPCNALDDDYAWQYFLLLGSYKGIEIILHRVQLRLVTSTWAVNSSTFCSRDCMRFVSAWYCSKYLNSESERLTSSDEERRRTAKSSGLRYESLLIHKLLVINFSSSVTGMLSGRPIMRGNLSYSLIHC